MADEKFGRRLRDLMKENKITERELARQICVNNQTMAQYCSGEIVPGIFGAKRLAKALGVTDKYLLYGVEEKHYSVTIEDTCTGKVVYKSDNDGIFVSASICKRAEGFEDTPGDKYGMTVSSANYGMLSEGTFAGIVVTAASTFDQMLNQGFHNGNDAWLTNEDTIVKSLELMRKNCDRIESLLHEAKIADSMEREQKGE